MFRTLSFKFLFKILKTNSLITPIHLLINNKVILTLIKSNLSIIITTLKSCIIIKYLTLEEHSNIILSKLLPYC